MPEVMGEAGRNPLAKGLARIREPEGKVNAGRAASPGARLRKPAEPRAD